MDDKIQRSVYVSRSLWRELKSLLAAKGESISGWFHRVAKKEVEQAEENTRGHV